MPEYEDESKPDPPAPAPAPITPEQADHLLGALVTMAANHPDNPTILLTAIKAQPKELVKATILRAMPFPWHNAIQTLVGTQSDDETRLTACLFAVVFVQGAGMRHRAMGA